MTRANQILRYIPMLLSALLMMAGCDATVHEYPEGEAQYGGDFTLRFHFTDSLPQYKVIEVESRADARAEEACDLRVLVEAFRTDGTDAASRTPDYTFTYTVPTSAGKDFEVHPNLPPGEYRFMAWADWVAQGSTAAKFYDASDFAEITLLRDASGSHQGNTDRRDAFRGVEETAVRRTADEVCTVRMERPLAKYEFITTDLDEFISRVSRQTGGKAQPEGRAMELSDYRVVFTYPLFMPCSYNMYTDKPADSWTAVSFEGSIERLSDTEARIGFDYVFVNGSEAVATVAVAILDSGGAQVASIAALTVPLKRSRLTTVRGKFLTATAGGTVGINPDFDGEFNIRIN